jgi:hypothetical protein
LAGRQLQGRWNWEVARLCLIEIIDVEQLEMYHERYLFRDIMLVISNLTIMFYAVLIQGVACRNCDTPFSLAAILVLSLSVIRLCIILLRVYFDYFRLREMCQEIRFYKSWRDEKRFKEDVVPSLAFKSPWNFYVIFETLFFLLILSTAFLALVWVENGSCSDTCPRAYNLTMYLCIGVFVFEGVYALSVIALSFFHRSLGVEMCEKLIAFATEDNKKRADARMEKLKLEKEVLFTE